MRRWMLALMMAVVLGGTVGVPSSASACPMCKIAHEDSKDPAVLARPRAYMYSILFMLSMPASLVSGFGIAFYRMARQQRLVNEANGYVDGLPLEG